MNTWYYFMDCIYFNFLPCPGEVNRIHNMSIDEDGCCSKWFVVQKKNASYFLCPHLDRKTIIVRIARFLEIRLNVVDGHIFSFLA